MIKNSVKKEKNFAIIDNRKFGYFKIDNEFVDANFDVYVAALYQRIARRASNNEYGFFEYQATTCKALHISRNTLKAALYLLSFCNIITIEHRRSPDNPKVYISSKILLVDKENWNLSHGIRTIKQFKEIKLKLKQVSPSDQPLDDDDIDWEDVCQEGWSLGDKEVGHSVTEGLVTQCAEKNTTKKNTTAKENGSVDDDLNNINNNSITKASPKDNNINKANNNANSILYVNSDPLVTRKKRLIHDVKTLHKIAVSQNASTFVAFETIESIAAKFFDKYQSKLDLVGSFLDDSIAQNKAVPIAKLESSFLVYQNFLSGKDESILKNIPKSDLNLIRDTGEEKTILHSQELTKVLKNGVKTIPEIQQTMLHKKAIKEEIELEKLKEKYSIFELKEKYSIFELKEKFKIKYILPDDLKYYFKSLNNPQLVKNIMRSDGIKKTAAEFERYFFEEIKRIAERKIERRSRQSIFKLKLT